MAQFYFKINLNKFGELKKQQEIEKKTFWGTAITYGIGVLIILIVFFILLSFLNKRIDSRKRLLSKIKKEIKSYQVSGEYLSGKDLETIANLSTNRVFWAKKLVALADITSKKLAITKFAYKNGTLSLYGITKVDKNQKEFDLIDQFINSLKNNPAINQDFPEIKFVRSTRDKEKGVEILRFQIDCSPKKEVRKKGRKQKGGEK